MKIRHLLTTLCLLALCTINLLAAPLKNIERVLTQPDGTKLYCFASGDEFYNRLHDAEGFTIVQADNGYFVYADKDTRGKIVATQYIAGKTDPKSVGLKPNIMISQEEYHRRREAKKVPEIIDSKNLNHGVYNNLVVFIKFRGDTDLTTTKTEIDSMFNNDGYYDISMNNYFKKATYNQLSMKSYCYPEPEGDMIIAYEDIYPRNYFQPYNPTTNPEGYTDQAEREFPLLKRAIEYVEDQIPDTLNIDRNDDGMVDNVIFVVKGNVGDWADLLWPHMWSLYGEDVYIHGKRVWTFNFQLETSSYFSTSTLCHEMSHSLGFPDLYHYVSGYDYLSPSGGWDLMCSNSQPPQHSATYMKYKYGTWIEDIPMIEYGTYTLEANSWEGGRRNCYMIPSSHPDQFYLIEYRNKNNMFEKGLPGHGLLIYRIDTRFHGCADYNGYDTFDEVYIFRPGGSQTQNGTINNAAYSKESGRTVFNHTTDPYPFLNNNIIDEEFNICNISAVGDQMTFTYCPKNIDIIPQNLLVHVDDFDSIFLEWDAVESAESYNVYRDGVLIKTEINNYCGDGHELELGYHEYYVTANCSGEESYHSNVQSVITGDYCVYDINMHTTGENGWQGGEITISFDNGMDDIYMTLYSGQSSAREIIVPSGIGMSLSWTSGWNDTECSFTITQDEEEIYVSEELQEGHLIDFTTTAGNTCIAPQNLTANTNGTGALLRWTSMADAESYVIMRNGETIAENIIVNEYFDNSIPTSGVYHYTVMSANDNCISEPSNIATATVMTYVVDDMSINAYAENDTISLSWSTPLAYGNLSYNNLEYDTTMECTPTRNWGIKISPINLKSFEGLKLKSLEFFDIMECTLTFNIYNGETPHDSILIHSEVYEAAGIEDIVMVNLSEEVPFDHNKDLWITVKPSKNSLIACNSYKGDPNSCYMKIGSTWKPVVEFNQNFSWILNAYTTSPEYIGYDWIYKVFNNGSLVEETYENETTIPLMTSGEQCIEVHALNEYISTSAELCLEAYINVNENKDNIATIYPNPVEEILIIKADNIKNIKIFSLTGVVMYEKETNANNVNINVEDLPSGSYLVQIITTEGTTTKQIIVK